MSYEYIFEYIFKKKLLKRPNLSAQIIMQYIHYCNNTSEEIEKIDFTLIRSFNKYYNNNKCYKCLELKEQYETKFCLKCKKRICFDCDNNNYYLCMNCIQKCEICNEIREELLKCETCEKLHCNSNCGHVIYFENLTHNFCNKKCVPYNLYFKILKRELNAVFRQKILTDNLNLYNIIIEDLLSIIKDVYIKEKIRILICNYNFKLSDYSFEKVSQKLCEIKYLHEYCNIEYYLNISEINQFSKCAQYQICKNIALKNKEFPVIWPWEYQIKKIHNSMMYKCIQEFNLLPRNPKNYFPGGIEFLNLEKKFLEKIQL